MKSFGSQYSASFSCSTAVAGSSAYNIPMLDTAGILAVSICVLPLLRIRKVSA